MVEEPTISIGYVIVRPRYEGDELLVSASPETCPRYPPDEILPWVSGKEADPQVARNEPWRLDPELQSWASKSFGSAFGWQAVFYRVDPAIEFRNRFLGEVDDAWVLGIGLPEPILPRVLVVLEPPAQSPGFASVGPSGHYEAAREHEPLANGGRILGFEPIRFFHTLLDESARPLRVRRAGHEVEPDVRRDVASICARLNRGESGFWCPATLARYG